MKKTRAISGIAVALCTLAITNTAYASETTTLPTHLMNGSFENPVVPTISDNDDDQSGGSKGAWYLNYSDGFEKLASEQGTEGFYWKTTAYTGKIELASPNRGGISGYGVSAAYDGDQFAELVADEQSSLYQNISTPEAGTVLNWGLSHAGRSTNDTMALFIGAAQSNYTKTSSAGNDIFMWMAELIKNTSNIEWQDASIGVTKHTVYSQADIDLSAVTTDNYTEYFSFSKTATINQEWRCWLITDAAGTWGTYNDIYTVPDGQTETTFAFTALTEYENYPLVAGQYNEGNLLDGITFATTYPLRVATTEGGTGTVMVNGSEVANVTYTSDHISTYDDGTVITVKATANEGYHLLGAFINGVFCTGNEEGHFTVYDDGSLSHDVVMDTPRYVQLIFGIEGTVIYDPNGGTYNGIAEDTEIIMSSVGDEENGEYGIWNNPYGDAVPTDDKTKFIGWYVGRITHNGASGGGLISSKHTVTYNTGSVTGDTSDDTFDLEYELVIRGENGTQSFDFSDGLVFVAEWEYLQETGIKTKDMEHAHYEDSSTGGTITQTIADIDSPTVRTNGYGRPRDVVTLHATANDGYRFRGWYDEAGNLLSIRSVYEYEVAQPTKVYAYFSELHHPVVSFVSATGEEQLENRSTHTIYKGSEIDSLTGIGGENIYGNTISTGFITWQHLEHDDLEQHMYGYSQWSITLPAPTADKPIYIKKTAASTSNDFLFDDAFIIEDADGVQANKGNIYKVTSLANDATEIIINLFNTLPTHVSTEGSIDLIYNITLDNIYAPGAEATLDLKANEEDMLFESIDIRNDESKYIHSATLDEYLTDEHNEYSSVNEEVE